MKRLAAALLVLACSCASAPEKPDAYGSSGECVQICDAAGCVCAPEGEPAAPLTLE